MPSIRPTSCLRAARAAAQQRQAVVPTRHFATTPRRAGGGAPQYDPPTGWLFGVRPGEKYEKEGWENLFFYGFYGSLAVFAVAYAFKPDTSIQTWALEEARRRLEAEGILEDPFPEKK
ncbi:ESSS subunit of NADH:ubiquinone oxidoreductase-domain-containing protein [Cercophora newfieldiana]|uniref:NADH dehydrogenase [ubiquinone] 1 beta subcomplex subunit 11, mitochondrial n=1 Tax=Cercophora newfieldiana TaxID=92897 RepID=A0AA40CJA7_9PEZI|nr:ESSS subunit of NADH:ubiquinone oxidoreductase-domain-containing protein [Cercophora newfieldiana]